MPASMMLLQLIVFTSSIVASSGNAARPVLETDTVTLLQGQIQEKGSKSSADGHVDVEPANSYNLADGACERKEAAGAKIPASRSEPKAPTANFAETIEPVPFIRPVRLTPESESGDPHGANTLRTLLEIAIIAIVFDSMRRWRLQKKEAETHSAKAAKSDPVADWTEMVNAASAADEAKFAKAFQRSPSVLRTDTWGCTALHFAAAGGSTKIAAELLKKGAEVDALDASEETPLHFAARAGHVSICEMLLEAGAKIDAINVQDLTPLVIAGQANQESTCRLLADCGAGAAGMSDEQLPPLVMSQLVRKVFAGAQ